VAAVEANKQQSTSNNKLQKPRPIRTSRTSDLLDKVTNAASKYQQLSNILTENPSSKFNQFAVGYQVDSNNMVEFF
jgi:hypothetical protein